MLIFKFLLGLVSRESITSMAYVALLISPLISLAGCAGEGAGGSASNSELAHADGGDEDPIMTMTQTPTGITAQLTWDPPPNFEVAGYDIYYGKGSSEPVSSEESVSEELGSEGPSSCISGEKQTVDGPQATITGLDPNTEYFFVIRAFNKNESESLCSNEIRAVTLPI